MQVTPASAIDIDYPKDISSRLEQAQWIFPARTPVDASEREYSPKPFGSGDGTVMRLSGVLERGDYERVVAALDSPDPGWFKLLVLDSPGGNFLEALRIGQHLQYILNSTDPNLAGVTVLKGDRCLSACSLILAMGQGVIEEGAEVGFHMGILPEDQAQSQARVQDIMNLTYDIVLEYTALIGDGHQSPFLLREALRHRDAESFFMLQGGLRSWGLGFEPYGTGPTARPIDLVGLDLGTAQRLCNVMLAANIVEFYPETQRVIETMADGLFFAVSLDETGRSLKDEFARLGPEITLMAQGAKCLLKMGEGGTFDIGIYEDSAYVSDSSGPTCISGESSFGYCASTGGVATQVKVGFLAEALGCVNGVLTINTPGDDANYYPDWIEAADQRSGVAKAAVNVRNAPGMSGTVISKLNADQSVEILNCAITDDAQGVWFEVSSGGTTGWVSARFISEEIWSYPIRITH